MMQPARTLATMCGPVLSGLALSACSLEPDFHGKDGERALACYTEDARGSLNVAIGDDAVVLTDQGKQVRLTFVASVWPRFEDRYEGEGHVLTFDPEAFLKRPDGTTRGPCL